MYWCLLFNLFNCCLLRLFLTFSGYLWTWKPLPEIFCLETWYCDKHIFRIDISPEQKQIYSILQNSRGVSQSVSFSSPCRQSRWSVQGSGQTPRGRSSRSARCPAPSSRPPRPGRAGTGTWPPPPPGWRRRKVAVRRWALPQPTINIKRPDQI